MKNWQEAEKDCTAALEINPKYAKVGPGGRKSYLHISTFDSIFFSLQALDRRGQARLQLQKFTEALEDFEEAKRIDPKTAAVDKNISLAKAGMGEPAVDKAGAKA